MLMTVPACDVCQKHKTVTNNWFVVFRKSPVKGLGRSRFAVFDWSASRAAKKHAKHICGEGCLSTFISQDLANRTSTARPVVVMKEQA
jgi:hypothetical protein